MLRRYRIQRRPRQRGFALIVIVLVVALAAATVSLALKEATSGLAEAGGAKSSELVYADLNTGLAAAIAELASNGDLRDLADRSNPLSRHDIFNTPPDPPFKMPNASAAYLARNAANGIITPDANAVYGVPVTVGVRPGQKTNIIGDDVRSSYGFVFEVQLQADLDTTGLYLGLNNGTVPAQERASVGVRIPQIQAHSNN
jgi:hypothetical protein